MLEYLVSGGWIMWPILGCSVVALGIYLERRTIMKASEVDADSLLDAVGAKLGDSDLDGAIGVCENTPGPVAETMAVGLRKLEFLQSVGKSPEEIEAGVNKAMEDHGAHVQEHLERNLPMLATVAALAPLIGMFGTVVGLVQAFSEIMAAGNVRPDKVAGGISVALLTTAAGLAVAVPATLFYNLLAARVTRFLLQVQSAGTELVEHLLALQVGQRRQG